MGNKVKKYFSKPFLRLIDQKNDLKIAYPETNPIIKNGLLIWIGKVKTGPFSKEYTIKIEYKIGKSPAVWLINELLNINTYKNIPHNYEVDFNKNKIRLCLYTPGRKEWTSNSSIAKTIVPWAIEWIYFYEIWQITGKWQGGGNHPK